MLVLKKNGLCRMKQIFLGEREREIKNPADIIMYLNKLSKIALK